MLDAAKSALAVATLFLTSLQAAVAAERTLTGPEIAPFLQGIVSMGENSRQTFSHDGTTSYSENGRYSAGRWQVQGDKYCSQWPPNTAWACYNVTIDEEAGTIIWQDGSDNPETGTYKVKDGS